VYAGGRGVMATCHLNLDWVDWGLVVALISLGITLISMSRQRRHDRLSVRPALKISADYPRPNFEASIRLENHGLGTAIIRAATITVGAEAIDAGDGETLLGALSRAGFPNDISVGPFSEDEPVRAGSELKLLTVPSASRIIVRDFVMAWSRLRVEIHYESMYEEKFTLKWSGLDPMSPESQARSAVLDRET
jgi:hypothetical protein